MPHAPFANTPGLAGTRPAVRAAATVLAAAVALSAGGVTTEAASAASEIPPVSATSYVSDLRNDTIGNSRVKSVVNAADLTHIQLWMDDDNAPTEATVTIGVRRLAAAKVRAAYLINFFEVGGDRIGYVTVTPGKKMKASRRKANGAFAADARCSTGKIKVRKSRVNVTLPLDCLDPTLPRRLDVTASSKVRELTKGKNRMDATKRLGRIAIR